MERDDKGCFVKGNISGFQPGNRAFLNITHGKKRGRPKAIITVVKDALKLAENAMPKLYEDMIRDAFDPTIPIAVRQNIREYLSDRIYGKAPIAIDQRIKIEITGEQYLIAIEEGRRRHEELLSIPLLIGEGNE